MFGWIWICSLGLAFDLFPLLQEILYKSEVMGRICSNFQRIITLSINSQRFIKFEILFLKFEQFLT